MALPVLIVGAGIGGLTTALALHQRGFEVELYESVEQLRPLGVGINLLPHAVSVLQQLGVVEQLLELGVATQELVYFNKFGQQIWQEPRGKAAGLPYPQISIHRGELQMLLFETVCQRLGPDAVNLDCRVHQTGSTGQDARLSVAQGGREFDRTGSVVIAADGIHSTVRAGFYPDEGMPIWNGAIMWRGLTQTEQFLSGRSMFMAGHERQKFVAYPISQPSYLAGRSMTNWIAELRYPPTDLMEREDWNRPGDFAQFSPAFADWKFPWFDIPQLLQQAERCYEFPMVDRDPVDRWTFGRVTLLGDAAHPMYPIGSNGASQAILDADCIARELDEARDDPARALQRYQAQRLPATAAIVRANRGNGPEQVMQLAEERAPNGFADIEDVVPLAEREEIAARYKQVAGFSREALERNV